MKKTVTANIAGTVFHIEEDAYEQLQRYLAGIRANFSGSTAAKEIMADIEARIAELFGERLRGRNVVTPADVEHVMSVMGQPEDFADGASEASSASSATEPVHGKRYKRFFRDPDDKWVGGVFGGLAAYIGMDPIWLRVAMIVLVWASVGVLIPIYILLWILVPAADSPTARLQMRGEPVTVDNIKRVVEEGAERVSNEARELGRKWNTPAQKTRTAEILGKLIGVAIIVFAFSLLLGLITGLLGGTFSIWNATWTNEDLGLLDLGEMLFTSKSVALWTAIGAFVLLAIPIIALFLAGFRLLLNTRTPKWLGWTLVLIWFAALVPTIRGGFDLGREFKRENSVLTEVQLAQPTAGVLYLDALSPADSAGNWSVRFDDGELDVDFEGLHVENGTIFGAWARLDVERSADSLFHLKVLRGSRGNNAKAALDRAEGISYNVQQEGDALFVSPVIRYAGSDKFRAQDVHFTLEVPLGKSVFLRPGSEAVIYDIDNVTNTFDRDMLGRTWTMTPEGLEDPSHPRKLKNEVKQDELPPPPPDSTLSKKVAATVWRRPSPKTAPRPNHATATVTNTPAASVELPNVFKLLGLLGHS